MTHRHAALVLLAGVALAVLACSSEDAPSSPTQSPTTAATATQAAATEGEPMTTEAKDVTYATRISDGHEWQAAVFTPPGATEAPVAIILPGQSSDRSSPAFRDLAAALADEGIAAILADHWPGSGPAMMRSGGSDFREAIENAGCLVRSAGALAGVEATRVILYGQSAGGLGGIFVTLEDEGTAAAWDTYDGGTVEPQIECANEGAFRIDGFVGLNGGFEAPYAARSLDEDLAGFLTMFSRVDRPSRVLRFIVSSRDEIVPPPILGRHQDLFTALTDAGHDVTVTTVDDVHIPETDSPGWQASLEAIRDLARATP
jgi:dienelactone hydrolase